MKPLRIMKLTTLDIFFTSARSVKEYSDRVRERSALVVNPWIHPGGKGAGVQVGVRI